MICSICNTEFQAKTSNRYCSPECRIIGRKQTAHPHKYPGTCEICGKPFMGIRANQRTCSKLCGNRLITSVIRIPKFELRHQRSLENKKKRAEAKRQASRQKRIHPCPICGKESINKHCSRACELESGRRAAKASFISVKLTNPYISLVCKECGKEFKSNYHANQRLFCSKKCADRNYSHYGKSSQRAARRARLRGVRVERVSKKYIYERDGWICQICHKRVNKRLKFPHLLSGTLDHIIPIAKGGTHEPKNCQLAHLICNSNKREVGESQLLLIG